MVMLVECRLWLGSDVVLMMGIRYGNRGSIVVIVVIVVV